MTEPFWDALVLDDGSRLFSVRSTVDPVSNLQVSRTVAVTVTVLVSAAWGAVWACTPTHRQAVIAGRIKWVFKGNLRW